MAAPFVSVGRIIEHTGNFRSRNGTGSGMIKLVCKVESSGVRDRLKVVGWGQVGVGSGNRRLRYLVHENDCQEFVTAAIHQRLVKNASSAPLSSNESLSANA